MIDRTRCAPLWTNDGSSGPSLPSVLPGFIGSTATSDSLPGIVAALSGFALIRFPTGGSRLRRTEQGLSGCADALSLRATALYTVPAGRIGSRLIPVRSRLHLQGTGSPREKIQLNWR